MSLADKNQSFFQKHHKFLAAVLAIALPYAGFNGYKEVQLAMAPASSGDTNIAITTVGPSGPSQIEIQVLIDKAMDEHQESKTYHEFQK